MAENTWFYVRDGERVGPFKPPEILQLVRAGLLDENTIVSDSGGHQIIARHVHDFFQQSDFFQKLGAGSKAAPPTLTAKTDTTNDLIESLVEPTDGATQEKVLQVRRDPLIQFCEWSTGIGFLVAFALHNLGVGRLVFAAIVIGAVGAGIRFLYRASLNLESGPIVGLQASGTVNESTARSDKWMLQLATTIAPGWNVVPLGVPANSTGATGHIVLYEDKAYEPAGEVVAVPPRKISDGHKAATAESVGWLIPLKQRHNKSQRLTVSGYVQLFALHGNSPVLHTLTAYFTTRIAVI